MKRLSLAAGLLLCLLALLARPARADTPSATILFTMPSSVDPAQLHFTQDGSAYSTDDQGNTLYGSTFLPEQSPDHTSLDGGAGGLEVHDSLDGENGPAIKEIWLATYYQGTVALEVQAANGDTTTPWTVIQEDVQGPMGAEQLFRFRWQEDAPELVGNFHGLFSASSLDSQFQTAQFSVTGFSSLQPVPEAGTVVTLGGLLALGGAGLRLRRRRGAELLAAASAPEAPR